MTHLITSIEPSEKDPNARDIYVQGKFAMTVPCATIEELQLTVEQAWDDAATNAIETACAIASARQIALDLITRRTWGSGELRSRLVKRGSTQSVAEETVEQLVEDGWLDDHAFARALIRQWLRKEPAGRRWLAHKLREKEVDPNTAKRAIDEELGEQSEQYAADLFAATRFAKISSDDEGATRKKIVSALTRKGFAIDVAAEAFRKAQEAHS
ncbi:MAG: regulatory protein RecX [Planctomycetes bacterium]|nr:regulatory protein RecX [Planctomycetota bacterium]